MGFVCFLLYLVVLYLFPGELFPALIPYRLPFWLGILGLLVSVLTLAPVGRLNLSTLPIGLAAGLVVSMMLSGIWADRWLGAPLYVVQNFGPVLTLFLLAIWNVTSLRRIRIAAAITVMSAMALVGQGVAAYHFGYMGDKLLIQGAGDSRDEEEAAEEDPAPVRIRGLGQLNDPNDLALVLVGAFPLLGLAWQMRRTVRNVLIVYLPAAVLVYGVYLTRSRGGMLGILAAIFASLVGRLSRTKALLATGMIAALLVAANFSGGRAMSTREESAAGRLDAWSEGIDMYRSNPVLGVGFHNFVEHHERTAHNSFVLCFAELGTVGYFFWLGLLTVPILQLKQVSHCIPNDLDGGPLRPYPRVLLASFSGILVAAVFLSRTYTPVLYLFVGLADALFAIARNSGEPIKMPGLCALGRRVVALEFASIIAVYVFIRLNRLLL